MTKVNRRVATFIALTLLLCLFVMTVVAEGETYSITVYKLRNETYTKPNFKYDMTRPLTEQNLTSHKLLGIDSSKIHLYQVDDDARLTLEDLDQDLEKYVNVNQVIKLELEPIKTMGDGYVKFEGLAPGRYYVRDATDDDYKGASVLIDLPYVYVNEETGETYTLNDPIITLKVYKEEEPELEQKFRKINHEDEVKYLPGATFKVVTKDENGDFVPVIKDGKVYTVTSDERGEFVVSGLPEGQYYLIETASPYHEGIKYKPLEEPLPFELLEAEMDSSSSITIKNKPGPPDEPPEEPPDEPPETPDEPPENPPKTPPETPSEKPPERPFLEPPENPLEEPPDAFYEKLIPRTGNTEMVLNTFGGIILFLLGVFLFRKARKA